jgi:hypothetical protein
VSVTELFTPVPPTVEGTSPLFISEPAILLFVKVCVSLMPTIALVGAVAVAPVPKPLEPAASVPIMVDVIDPFGKV